MEVAIAEMLVTTPCCFDAASNDGLLASIVNDTFCLKEESCCVDCRSTSVASDLWVPSTRPVRDALSMLPTSAMLPFASIKVSIEL